MIIGRKIVLNGKSENSFSADTDEIRTFPLDNLD